MTNPEQPPVVASVDAIRKALNLYRVLAWATGIWLIALVYEMYVKYVMHVPDPPNWIAIVHGWCYFAYLMSAANLAVKVRWSIGKTIGVLIAGTIPIVGIVVEHFQTQEIRERFNF